MIVRALFLFAFLVIPTILQANIYVQPLQRVIEQRQQLGGGRYIGFPLSLEQGSSIHVYASAHGGIDNAVKMWLVDLDNYQLLASGRRFRAWTEASPRIVGQGYYSFRAPVTSVYYVVADNRPALLTRDVYLRVDKEVTTSTQTSTELTRLYSARYGALKKLFIFPEFNVTVRPCDAAPNSFSNPNIVICTELLESVQEERVPAAEVFIFSHEVAHSLLYLWNYPGFDNEDTADEFATVLLMFLKQDNAALQGAQWWANRNSQLELKYKLLANDRHSPSVQRARNILNWLNQKADLERRWLHIMIPNMTDAALQGLAQRAGEGKVPSKDLPLVQLVREELKRRQRPNLSP